MLDASTAPDPPPLAPNKPTSLRESMLLSIQILHDVMHQYPRNYGSIVHVKLWAMQDLFPQQ